MTEPGGRAWRQTIFHPFAQSARLARGQVLRVEPTSPRYGTLAYGEVPLLHATATHDPDTGQVCVLAVNRGTDEALPLAVDLHGFGPVRLAEHSVLSDDDPYAVNTADHPDRVVPRPGRGARVEDGRLDVLLPPVSWNVLRLTPAPRS